MALKGTWGTNLASVKLCHFCTFCVLHLCLNGLCVLLCSPCFPFPFWSAAGVAASAEGQGQWFSPTLLGFWYCFFPFRDCLTTLLKRWWCTGDEQGSHPGRNAICTVTGLEKNPFKILFFVLSHNLKFSKICIKSCFILFLFEIEWAVFQL